MKSYDKMKIELLSGAKAAPDYLPIRFHELALKYGIEQRHVCEKLVEFHTEKLIRLSAWDDNETRDKPFDEWPKDGSFFACRWDGNYKRVQLLVRGAEFLENLAASELPLSGQQVVGADADGKFARLAIEEARKSVAEPDGRPHPKVGAVVVKGGQMVSAAHRGEVIGNHAEFLALEGKLSDEAVAGATIYTTLEPCTTRKHPKIPCAERLVERKVSRVVIGMLDPDERIRGLGVQKLRNANIVVEFFPPALVPEVEEMNREFTRSCTHKVERKDSVDNKGEKVAAPSSRPKPNIKFVEARSIDAHRGIKDELLYDSPSGLGDFRLAVVCFRNDAMVGQPVAQPKVKAHIIYRDSQGKEITDSPGGVWLRQYGETTPFTLGQKRCLVIFMLSKQNTLMKLWNETYTTADSWMADGPLFRIRQEGLSDNVASVSVSLLTGDTCLVCAVFDVEESRSEKLAQLVLRSISEG